MQIIKELNRLVQPTDQQANQNSEDGLAPGNYSTLRLLRTIGRNIATAGHQCHVPWQKV